MTVRRLFLDTHQWNYLVARDGYTGNDLAEARDSLKRGLVRGDWIVVGSLPMLQELMGAAVRDKAKYEQMRDLAFDVVGSHWLLPLNERYVREIAAGGLLPERQRYLSRDHRRTMERLARRSSTVQDVADATHTETATFKAEQERVREVVLSKLTAEPEGPPPNMHKAMGQWWERRDLEGWVRGILDSSLERGYIPTGTTYSVSEPTMPSAWRFTDFKQARIRLNLGAQRAIGTGDYFDADIYGASPYFDLLITDDKAFVETCALIGDGSLEVSDFSGLLALLETGNHR